MFVPNRQLTELLPAIQARPDKMQDVDRVSKQLRSEVESEVPEGVGILPRATGHDRGNPAYPEGQQYSETDLCRWFETTSRTRLCSQKVSGIEQNCNLLSCF